MNPRQKLLLPFIFLLLLALIGVYGGWLPTYQAQQLAKHRARAQAALQTATLALAVLPAENTTAYVERVLQQLQARQPAWRNLRLIPHPQLHLPAYPTPWIKDCRHKVFDMTCHLAWQVLEKGENQPASFLPLGLLQVRVDLDSLVAQDVHAVRRLAHLLLGLLGVATLIALLQNWWLQRSLHKLAKAASAVANGNYDVAVPAPANDAVGEFTRAFDHMRRTLQERESALAESEHHLAAVIDNSVEAIITIDEQGKVQDFNQAAEWIFGYRLEEMIGHEVWQLLPEPYRTEYRTGLQTDPRTLLSTGRELQGLRKDHSAFPVWLAVGEARLAPDHLFVFTLLDITEQKNSEAELRMHRDHLEQLVKAQTADLVTAKEVAEAANQAKSMFLANMSHEIRTPMNAIIGMTELVLEKGLEAEQRKLLEIVYRSAKSLLSLLNRILDLSKLERDRMEFETLAFDLRQLLGDTVATLAATAQAKGLALNLDIPEQLPHCVRSDPTRIRQVLTNLLGNAVKFTETGSVSVAVKHFPAVSDRREVEPDDNSVSTLYRFTVRDTGIGIPPERLPHIFDSFTQADNSTARRYGGTGLGTTIAKQIVEHMGGSIQVSSELHKGTVFEFTLPLEIIQDAEACRHAEQDSVLHPRVAHSLKVLLTEDIEENVTLAEMRLQQAGHRVRVAYNGREAVDAYRNEPFDVILMDVQMPEMDGFEATRAIRALEQGRGSAHIPIIAMTANVLQRDKDQCREAGMDGFVTKPIDFSVLFQTINSLVPADAGQALDEVPPTASEEAPEAMPEIIGVDFAKGIETWQNTEAYCKALRSFAQKHAASGQRLCTLVEADDIGEARKLAHALRGTAANLAMHGVAAQINRLSSALRENQRELFAPLLAKVTDSLESTCQAIIALKQSETCFLPKEEAPVLSAEVIQDLLNALREALHQTDMDRAESVLEKLVSQNPPGLSVLQDCLDNFDFDQAEQVLDEMMVKVK